MTGAEIRAARINAGFSVRGLGRELNMPEQTIRRLEADLGASPANAKKLADWLGVTVLDVLPVEDADRSAA